MGALAQASMHAVECAINAKIATLLVNLAVSASVLWVADTCSVVAPSCITAVVGAGLEAAINSTETWFTPASSVHADTVVCAVVNADGDRAVNSVEVGAANASSVVALSVV